MKKTLIAVSFILLYANVITANATLVTALPAGTIIAMAETNTFGSGPITHAPSIIWTSSNTNAVFTYTNGYGFSSNGFWGDTPAMAGTNSPVESMTWQFENPLTAVGGLINYSTDNGSDPTIAVYDSANNLLESAILSFSVLEPNGGQFYGFQSAFANISYFTLSGSYIGLRNLTIDTEGGQVPSAVPVPAAAWLFGSAALGFFGLRRKNQV